MEAARVRRFLGRDCGEDVGDAAGDQLHGQAGGATGPGGGLVEQEAVARVGDMRHAGGAGGHAGQEAADGHVGVDEIGFFGAEQGQQGTEGAVLRQRGQAAGQFWGFQAKTFGADVGQQRAVGADSDHFVPTGAGAAHQGEQEVPQREIDIGDFDDFHRTDVSAPRRR
jgi:hypothetical protein